MNKKVKYGITLQKALLLLQAWEYADQRDKSTEWMLQYMQDTAGVDLDAVLYFLKESPSGVTHEKVQEFWEERLQTTRYDNGTGSN